MISESCPTSDVEVSTAEAAENEDADEITESVKQPKKQKGRKSMMKAETDSDIGNTVSYAIAELNFDINHTCNYTGSAYVRFLFTRQALFTNDRARFYERVSG